MLDRIKRIFKTYREQILYLVFGVLTTLVDFSVSFLLYRFWLDAASLPPVALHAADTLAWAAAVTFAFVTNRIWVFESTKTGFFPIARELCTFAGGRVLTLLLQEGAMLLFVTLLGGNKYLFRVLIAVAVVVLNYVISKLFVFRKRQE